MKNAKQKSSVKHVAMSQKAKKVRFALKQKLMMMMPRQLGFLFQHQSRQPSSNIRLCCLKVLSKNDILAYLWRVSYFSCNTKHLVMLFNKHSHSQHSTQSDYTHSRRNGDISLRSSSMYNWTTKKRHLDKNQDIKFKKFSPKI